MMKMCFSLLLGALKKSHGFGVFPRSVQGRKTSTSQGEKKLVAKQWPEAHSTRINTTS